MVQSSEKSLQELRLGQRDLKAGQATLSTQIAELDAKFAAVDPDKMVFADLEAAGGIRSFARDAVAADEVFVYTPEAGQVVEVHRVLLAGFDSKKIVENGFWTLGPLPDGDGMLCAVVKTGDPSTVLLDFLAGREITEHADFGLLGDVVFTNTAANRASWEVRWTIESAGRPLRMTDAESLAIINRGNLSTLESFGACLQGIIIDG